MRKLTVYLIIPFLAISILPAGVFAQDDAEFGRYNRKSISYIPAVYIPRSEAYEMRQSEIRFLIKTVREYIEMPRFDYNELPETITDEFVRKARGMGGVTPSEMQDLLDETVVPVIMDILDTQKEMRARNLVTEEQKQQFIATKAQSYGITARQLETVLNSAYLYIPYVDWVDFEEEKGIITFTIKGGLLWYHIIPDVPSPRVEPLLKKETISFGKGQDDQRYPFKGELLKGEEFALYTAVDNFARNLQVATQSIPAFQLAGMIQYAGKNSIEFDLGKREGIKVDDGFFIKEQYEEKSGEVDARKVGFVRTTAVGNNKNNPTAVSIAAPVMGSNFTRGMALVEHPRLPLNVSFRARFLNLYVNSGYMEANWPFSDEHILAARFIEDYTGGSVGIDLEAGYHIGRWFDIPMLLFTAGITAGVPPVEIQVQSFQDRIQKWNPTIPALLQVRIGMTKKYFWRRYGLQVGGDFGLSALSANDKVWLFGEDGLELYSIALSNRTVGASLFTGIEYFITPDWTMGFTIGLQGYPESAAWTFDVENDSYPLVGIEGNRPSYSITGGTMTFYIQYRPPSLPFDPLNMIRAIVGI